MTVRTVHVSAAILTDDQGRALVVRKHGTTAFMQPGGKPEPGEDALQTVIRELEEELGVRLDPADLTPLGRYESDAANEPGHRVVADVFSARVRPDRVRAAAEIAEARWITPADTGTLPLAPLSLEHLLPLAWGKPAVHG